MIHSLFQEPEDSYVPEDDSYMDDTNQDMLQSTDTVEASQNFTAPINNAADVNAVAT